jgi:hypothetical protein
VRKEGNRGLYRADQEALRPFKEVSETMWGGTLQNLADEIEAAKATTSDRDRPRVTDCRSAFHGLPLPDGVGEVEALAGC